MKIECDECSNVYGFPTFIDLDKDDYVSCKRDKREYYHIWCYMSIANLTGNIEK